MADDIDDDDDDILEVIQYALVDLTESNSFGSFLHGKQIRSPSVVL